MQVKAKDNINFVNEGFKATHSCTLDESMLVRLISCISEQVHTSDITNNRSTLFNSTLADVI